MKLLTKLFLLFIPLAVLLIGAAVIISRNGVRRILVEEVHNRSLAQISVNMPAFSRAFEAGTETALLPLLQALKEQTQGAQAAALDRTGKVLAHTNVLEKNKIYSDAPTTGILRSNLPIYHETAIKGERVLETSMPVWSEKEENADFLLSAGADSRKQRLGTIVLGMPLSRTIQLQNNLFMRQAATLILAAGGLLLALMFFVIRMVLRPARRLADGISKVSVGRCSMLVPVSSNDELGQLTAAFNRMAGNLEKTTVSRDKLAEEVAERRQAEIALVNSEKKYRNLIETTRTGFLIIDGQGRVADANAEYVRLSGHRELGEILGHSVIEWTAGHSREKNAAALVRCIEDGMIRGLEIDYTGIDGQNTPVEINATVEGTGDGVRIISLCRDITERRKLEAAMLQSEKLSAVGQLAAGVAHEINNPLGIILGFAQSAARRIKNESDPLTLPLKTIEREALRCKNLVQNLLVFSRTSKGAEPEALDLNASVEGALSLISAQTKTCNVALTRELGADLPKTYANNIQLQQIVINLAGNAIDAMPKGGTLTVRTALSALRPGHVEIQVRDTGSGIPREIQKKIFEPFFTTKEVGKGTGLGLSLVYEIVAKHGGTIELESEEGAGAQFTVFLPVHPAAEAS